MPRAKIIRARPVGEGGCTVCNGVGHVHELYYNDPRFLVSLTCNTCGGSGSTDSKDALAPEYLLWLRDIGVSEGVRPRGMSNAQGFLTECDEVSGEIWPKDLGLTR